MGCYSSKLEDLEAVALCRQRCQILSEAIAHRYALAEAHAHYSRCLKSVGESLHRFLELESVESPSGPPLLLPAQRKGEDLDSGNLNFRPDSEDDDGEEFHLHSDGDDHGDGGDGEESPVGATVNYAKNQSPNPTISFERRPVSPGTVQFGYGHPYPAPNPSFYYPHANHGYPSNHSNYGGPSNYGNNGVIGGYVGSSSSPVEMQMGTAESEATQPPPSPPRVSNWEFLNLFEHHDGYYGNYEPSRSSMELREEEGIPALEDDMNEEKEKEKDSGSLSLSPVESNGDRISEVGEVQELVDAHASLQEENVVVSEVKELVEKQENAGALPLKRYRDLSDIGKDIELQFDRASDSAVELSEMLEVGKQPSQRRKSAYKASSARMICGANPLSSSKDELLVFEDDTVLASVNLSLTLHKLCIWEKKLLDEVVAEEKMRVVHDRKCREMKRLDQRGAEAHKLDLTLSIIRKLSTKIRIAIQVVDSISDKLSKIRDDELWPQISELIQGLMKMWSTMLECHRIQCLALSESKLLCSLASDGKISDSHMEVTKQLELKLLEWVASFFAWIHAQKFFVKALNGWLFVGLRVVQEETPDGIAPFSPGHLGASPVFVICNQWAQMIERISEQEVINAMNTFASGVLHIWEKHKFEQRQKLMANKDMDRALRIMEREEQEMRGAVEKNNKTLVVGGQSEITLFEHTQESNLQGSLRQVFKAMESFSASTLKAYEELNMRIGEERSAGENEKTE